MFLRFTTRKKNGKEHRYYSLVENRRLAGGRVIQRPVLYLGEINDHQQEAWRKTIEIFEEGQTRPRTVALFPEDRSGVIADPDIVRIRLSQGAFTLQAGGPVLIGWLPVHNRAFNFYLPVPFDQRLRVDVVQRLPGSAGKSSGRPCPIMRAGTCPSTSSAVAPCATRRCWASARWWPGIA